MAFAGAKMERRAPNWRHGKELTGLESGMLPQPYLAGGNNQRGDFHASPASLPSGRKRSREPASCPFTNWMYGAAKIAEQMGERAKKVRAHAHPFAAESTRVPPRTCKTEKNAGAGRRTGGRDCYRACVPILQLEAKHRPTKAPFLAASSAFRLFLLVFHSPIKAAAFSQASCAALFWKAFACTLGWFRVPHNCEQIDPRGDIRSSRLRRAL
jgi:hypothetical protein